MHQEGTEHLQEPADTGALPEAALKPHVPSTVTSAEMDAKFPIQAILGGISDTKEAEKAPSHHPAKRITLVKGFLNQALGLPATPAARALLCFEDIHLLSVPSPRQEWGPSSAGITACTRGFASPCCAAELGVIISQKRQRRMNKIPGAARSHGHHSLSASLGN